MWVGGRAWLHVVVAKMDAWRALERRRGSYILAFIAASLQTHVQLIAEIGFELARWPYLHCRMYIVDDKVCPAHHRPQALADTVRAPAGHHRRPRAPRALVPVGQPGACTTVTDRNSLGIGEFLRPTSWLHSMPRRGEIK